MAFRKSLKQNGSILNSGANTVYALLFPVRRETCASYLKFPGVWLNSSVGYTHELRVKVNALSRIRTSSKKKNCMCKMNGLSEWAPWGSDHGTNPTRVLGVSGLCSLAIWFSFRWSCEDHKFGLDPYGFPSNWRYFLIL